MKLSMDQIKELKKLDDHLHQFEVSSANGITSDQLISFYNFGFPNYEELEKEQAEKRNISRQQVFEKIRLDDNASEKA
jgi:hypothetical protein